MFIVAMFSGSLGFWAGDYRRPPPPSPEASVPLIVLARDLEPGQPLTPQDLTTAAWPRSTDGIPAGAERLVLGQALSHAHRAGDVVTYGELAEPGSVVMKKARAAALDITARSPWIKQGDHVDVLSSMEDPQTFEDVTVTLIQNAIVTGTLTVNDQTQRLTLLLIFEEAEALLLAQKLGKVDVTLRNPDDVDILEERGRATVYTLLSGERSRVLQQKRFTTGCILRGNGHPLP